MKGNGLFRLKDGAVSGLFNMSPPVGRVGEGGFLLGGGWGDRGSFVWRVRDSLVFSLDLDMTLRGSPW